MQKGNGDSHHSPCAGVRLAPTHGHQKTQDHASEADRVVPRAQLRQPGDLVSGEVVEDEPGQARIIRPNMITLYQTGVPPVLTFTGVRDAPLVAVVTGRASLVTFAFGMS